MEHIWIIGMLLLHPTAIEPVFPRSCGRKRNWIEQSMRAPSGYTGHLVLACVVALLPIKLLASALGLSA